MSLKLITVGFGSKMSKFWVETVVLYWVFTIQTSIREVLRFSALGASKDLNPASRRTNFSKISAVFWTEFTKTSFWKSKIASTSLVIRPNQFCRLTPET